MTLEPPITTTRTVIKPPVFRFKYCDITDMMYVGLKVCMAREAGFMVRSTMIGVCASHMEMKLVTDFLIERGFAKRIEETPETIKAIHDRYEMVHRRSIRYSKKRWRLFLRRFQPLIVVTESGANFVRVMEKLYEMAPGIHGDIARKEERGIHFSEKQRTYL